MSRLKLEREAETERCRGSTLVSGESQYSKHLSQHCTVESDPH